MKLSPDGNHAYVIGYWDARISWFDRNTISGELTYKASSGTTGLNRVEGIVLSGDGKFVYSAANTSTNSGPMLNWFERNATTGSLTRMGEVGNGLDSLNGVRKLVISPDDKHLYALSYRAINWFHRNITTGELTFGGFLEDNINGVDGLSEPKDLVLSADGMHLYITSSGDDAVSWYTRNSTSGALTFTGILQDGDQGVEGLGGAHGITLSLDGKNIYVVSASDDALCWFERNASTGGLIYKGVLEDGIAGVDGLDGAVTIAISNDDSYLYVTGKYDHSLSVFRRDTNDGSIGLSKLVNDSSYVLNSTDSGSGITVSANYLDGGGNLESVFPHQHLQYFPVLNYWAINHNSILRKVKMNS